MENSSTVSVTFTKQDGNAQKFVAELNKRINGYFSGLKIPKTGDSRLYNKTIIIGLSLAIVYITIIFSRVLFKDLLTTALEFYLGLGVLYLLLGAVMALIGFNVMHDASHGSYSKDKRVNEILSYSMNLIGGIVFFWNIKHNFDHHTNTNVFEFDEDIGLYPLLRIHESQKHLWFHKYQHYYGPILYLFSGPVIVHYNDFYRYFTQKIGARRFDFPEKEKRIFWISKIIHFTLFMFIPMYFVGASAGFWLYWFMLCVTGFIMSLIFQMAHLFEKTRFQVEPNVPYEWHVYQMLTTTDFAVKSKFWTWVLGGLNFQAIHHLYRNKSHVHYPRIQMIVEETANEFGIVYYNIPTFWQAFQSHRKLLRNLSVS